MKWSEITLDHVQPLRFGEREIATIEQRQIVRGITTLIIEFGRDQCLKLEDVVDTTEELDFPRVFVIEGSVGDAFVLFGGERVYWLSKGGSVKNEYQLFRKSGDDEYWATQLLEQENGLLIIYEAGVLAIDEALRVLWHKPKFYNDVFAGFVGTRLKFLRDHETEWLM
jgi:hypothetical protein